MTIPASGTEGDLFKIGVVASRTGISVERLRAWERRYGLAPAHRDGQTRFYSEAQVERLIAIKTLLDRGTAIRRVVHLDDEELARRAAIVPNAFAAEESGLHVGLVGAPLLLLHRKATTRQTAEETPESGILVVGSWPSVESFLAARDALPQMHRLVLFQASLDDQLADEIGDRVPDAGVVTAYRYASRSALEQFEHEGRAALALDRGVSWPDIEDACLAWKGPVQDDAQVAFSEEMLLHIITAASASTSAISGPLAEMLLEISHLSDHIDRCEEAGADQAGKSLASARSTLEAALEQLVHHNGLLDSMN
ncbi:MAG: MerR family transcriptional regulator [Gammaproteobacteria bacterium]|nr:MerR family transcriptional regulator [Gammaproteobacteria bacterium]MYB35951.1 MerR family transcriptional regulator [Gammaproteobacteria bacterium]